MFNDDSADTLYVCGRSYAGDGETHFGRATMVAVDDSAAGVDVTEVLRLLRARGCHRIFVEGGGVTVSMFLEANLLDRLQIAIAPLLIGDGRPAIRLPARTALSDCHRPALPRLPHGRRRAVRLRARRRCDRRHQPAGRPTGDHARDLTPPLPLG